MTDERYTEIVDRYANTVYKVALNYTKSVFDAEDIVQNVFLKVYKKSPMFKDEEHAKKWLIRVTVNECNNLWESFWNRNTTGINDIKLSDKPTFSTDEYEELYNEVMNLSEKYRIVIYLYYYEGYSINEISHLIGKNVNTVKTNLSRAKSQLKDRLGKE